MVGQITTEYNEKFYAEPRVHLVSQLIMSQSRDHKPQNKFCKVENPTT